MFKLMQLIYILMHLNFILNTILLLKLNDVLAFVFIHTHIQAFCSALFKMSTLVNENINTEHTCRI